MQMYPEGKYSINVLKADEEQEDYDTQELQEQERIEANLQ